MSDFPNTGSILDPRMGRSAMLARHWWVFLLRGIVAIVFAAMAFLLPFTTLGSLFIVLGIYLLVDGVAAIVAGFRAASNHGNWAWLLFEGVVGIIAGLFAIAMPALTLLVLIIMLAVWSVVSGVMLLVAAFNLHEGHGGWLMGLAAIASIAWGVLLYVFPIAGSLVLTWWLGGYALAFGIILIAFAFKLRSRSRPELGPGGGLRAA
jgi:uncharacterized membrane protein HdeD (DUF308 family)